jgi:hypothetical protein
MISMLEVIRIGFARLKVAHNVFDLVFRLVATHLTRLLLNKKPRRIEMSIRLGKFLDFA